jgi:hypothetical protein
MRGKPVGMYREWVFHSQARGEVNLRRLHHASDPMPERKRAKGQGDKML